MDSYGFANNMYEPAQGYGCNISLWIPMDLLRICRASARVRFQWIPMDLLRICTSQRKGTVSMVSINPYEVARDVYEPAHGYGFYGFRCIPMTLLGICTSQRRGTVSMASYGFLWKC